MKSGGLLLLAVGCGSGDCVVADAPVIESGTAVLSTGEETFATSVVAWTEASAPTITKSVSFWIEFGDRPSVQCDGIAWSSVAHGAVVNVSNECVVIDGSTGAQAQLAAATLSVTSALDASNEGTITLRFGAPDQTVTLVDTDVEVAVDTLVVSVSFAHTACSNGCSSFNLSGV